jgi:hypothetical protein
MVAPSCSIQLERNRLNVTVSKQEVLMGPTRFSHNAHPTDAAANTNVFTWPLVRGDIN